MGTNDVLAKSVLEDSIRYVCNSYVRRNTQRARLKCNFK